MGFILILKALRSPSLITLEPQYSHINNPPQVFAIMEDFGIQAQDLLQEIHKLVVKFLKEKPAEWFASEAFNLGFVYKELTQCLTIPSDWIQLGELVSSNM
jgi:hypothetical protein